MLFITLWSSCNNLHAGRIAAGLGPDKRACAFPLVKFRRLWTSAEGSDTASEHPPRPAPCEDQDAAETSANPAYAVGGRQGVLCAHFGMEATTLPLRSPPRFLLRSSHTSPGDRAGATRLPSQAGESDRSVEVLGALHVHMYKEQNTYIRRRTQILRSQLIALGSHN